MKSVFKNIFSPNKGADPIFIVSGLPRCGTSMMMQMLEAGGMSIVTDRIRQADEDNPRGYYELEKVKQIKEDVTWLGECHGKAFKMVSALLYDLPADKIYRIIFMKREMSEMLASQNVMLARKGERNDGVSDEQMAAKLDKHLFKVSEWLAKQKNMTVIYINYHQVIKDPEANAKRVSRFIRLPLHIDKMAKVVDRSLYRQRREEIPNIS